MRQGRNSIVIGAGANGDLRRGLRRIAVGGDREGARGARAVRIAARRGAGRAAHRARGAARRRCSIRRRRMRTVSARPARAHRHRSRRMKPSSSRLLARHWARRDRSRRHRRRIDDAALHALVPAVAAAGHGGGDAGRGGCVRLACGRCAARRCGRCVSRARRFRPTPVDTTGAGDAFSGALAASLAQREAAFAEHVRFAARYAARSTEREGAAEGMPRMLATA